ncbi:hypothetical protein RB195_008180 [Necator americanus]|uniref:Oxidoreductase, short chain dehydrogenase/reductase family protein n=2 Tax=Necator americanus TaxID=51031 RepID=A0ABR1CQQ5_NECAM
MALRFDGRVAIVTGAGGGLGRKHALELAKQECKVVSRKYSIIMQNTLPVWCAFNRVPHELLWMSMRSHRVPEEYVRWTKLLYAKPTSVVRFAAGTSRPFPVQVGVHQEAASVDSTLCRRCHARESRDDLQKQVQSWKDQLQKYGLRLNTSKTEYMECGPRIEDGSIRVDGTELNKATLIKKVRARVNAAWMKWKMATEDGCASCCECWPTTKALERVLHAMEMRMLRWTIGVTLKEKVSNDTVRSIFGVVPITEKMKEARLRWFGHVLRREEDSVAQTALKLDVSGVRPRGRPKIRWLDRVKLDMIDAHLCTADQWIEPNGRQEAEKRTLQQCGTNARKKRRRRRGLVRWNAAKVDIVISNVGILRDVSLVKMTDLDWDLIFKVHVKGAYTKTKAAWPYMRKWNYGRIIVTSSIAAIYGNFGKTNYAAAEFNQVESRVVCGYDHGSFVQGP